MKNKHLAVTLGTIIISLFILFSCRKINEATELGTDLIPPVDNITTFDTTLDVMVFNDTFSIPTDSTISSPLYDHFLGKITNDPLFGKTDAQIYLELKPSAFRYTFANKPDSLFLDSVVLVMDYNSTYGDSTVPQTVNVYEVGGQLSDFRYDTTYRIREVNIPKLGMLGSRTFAPKDLNDSVRAYLDTTSRQLRIRLDDSFGNRLLAYDTTTNGAYTSDSNFRVNFKGFALESTSGNALMSFSLGGDDTKLAIYYRYYKNGVSNIDTTVNYWTYSPTFSASANSIRRDYNGTPLAAAAGGAAPDNFAYIQATPGSFATIKVPGLAGLNNRIIHRAELIMEQAFDVSDTIFPPPGRLYLDAYDAGISKFRSVPFDMLIVDPSSSANNIDEFGSLAFRALSPGGKSIRTWHFNISRYVQHLVNGSEPLYDLRLHAPVYTVNQYGGTGTNEGTAQLIYVNSNATGGTPAAGRVRLNGGDPTHVNPQRMRVRIVYSKI